MAIEMDDGFKKLFGVAEATATLVTGMASAPAAGVVGISKGISSILGITDDDAESVAQTVEAISSAGTYTPKSAEGQQYLQAALGHLQYLGLPSEKVGEFFAAAAHQLGGSVDTQAATGAIAEAVIDPVDKIFPGLKAAGAAAAFGVVGDAAKMGRSQAVIMQALKLKRQGMSPEDIFKETRLYQGGDGVWRSVISDVDYSIKPTANMPVDPVTGKARLLGGATPLQDVIDHPELFKAFPFLSDVKILGVSRAEGDLGGYMRGTRTILVSDGHPQQMQSTILHEIQHAIQEHQNLAGGSSPEMFLPDHLKEIDSMIVEAATERRKWEAALEDKGYRSNRFFDAFDEPEYADYVQADSKFSDLVRTRTNARKDYRRTLGEAEARMVQDMWKHEKQYGRDPEQIPTTHMDTPFDQQIRSPGDLTRVSGAGGVIRAIDPERFVQDFPEFKGSAIRDPAGRLTPVYHGTVNQIQGAFRFASDSSGQLGIHFGDKIAASDRTVSQGFMRDLTRQGDPTVPEAMPNTHQVYLNIQRPVRLTDKGYWDSETVVRQLESRHDITPLQERIIEQYKIDNPLWRQGSNGGPSDSSVRKLIQKLGYDGVVYQNLYEGFGDSDSYIALDPKQIRSAVSGKVDDTPVMSKSFDPKPGKSLAPKTVEGFERLEKQIQQQHVDGKISFEEFTTKIDEIIKQKHDLKRAQGKDKITTAAPKRDMQYVLPPETREIQRYTGLGEETDITKAADAKVEKQWKEAAKRPVVEPEEMAARNQWAPHLGKRATFMDYDGVDFTPVVGTLHMRSVFVPDVMSKTPRYVERYQAVLVDKDGKQYATPLEDETLKVLDGPKGVK